MSTKLDVPKRTEKLIDEDGSPTRRVAAFFDTIPEIGDSQTPLTITWTSNEPTASTQMTIADGSAVTSTETGQAIQNLNTVLSNLIAELKAAGTIKT